MRFLFHLCAALASLAAVGAKAEVITVGGDENCMHSTLQEAVDRAKGRPGADVVQLARSGFYRQDPVRVEASAGNDLRIEGGYAHCGSAPDDQHTTVRALPTAGAVFAAKVSGGELAFRRLVISDGTGGGIDAAATQTSGVLSVADTLIRQNRASSGGGIRAIANAAPASLSVVVGPNVDISENQADGIGGGIYVSGAVDLDITAPNTSISYNRVSLSGNGYGGGVMIANGAVARIASGGLPPFTTTIAFNQASFGGGIAIGGTDGEAGSGFNRGKLHLYSTDAQWPAGVSDNEATYAGGGIFVAANTGTQPAGRVLAADVNIERNKAPFGAAAYLSGYLGAAGGVTGPSLSFNAAPIAGGVRCARGVRCNRIGDNVVTPIGGSAAGAVLAGEKRTTYDIRNAIVSGNSGLALAQAVGGPDGATSVNFSGSLIVDNRGDRLVQANGQADVALDAVTIARNTLALPPAMAVGGDFTLTRSIVWQPGVVSVDVDGTTNVADVVANETVSFGVDAQRVQVADPRFVDPDAGDFRLHASSPAVDYAAAVAGTDLDGLPRAQDLPLKPNRFGPTDLGAYERRSADPLVRNGQFDTAYRHWKNPNWATWVAESAPGSPGGSVKVESFEGKLRLTALRQCIFLPGPGVYRLNAAGRTEADPHGNDTLVLHWELRHDGGTACDAGPPDVEGDHIVAATSYWSTPAEPGYVGDIEDFRGAWTQNASVTIHLDVIDNGRPVDARVVGWFDAIALSAGGETIFSSGFELVPLP